MPRDVADLIDMTKAPVGNDGFLLEVHPKLRPVESAIPGLLLAGTAQAPMDITESTSAASAAAAKVTTLLAKDHVEMEPFVAKVDPSLCDGCGLCLDACQYAGAIALQDVEVEEGVIEKRAYVNPVACKGCGRLRPVLSGRRPRRAGLGDRTVPGHGRRHHGRAAWRSEPDAMTTADKPKTQDAGAQGAARGCPPGPARLRPREQRRQIGDQARRWPAGPLTVPEVAAAAGLSTAPDALDPDRHAQVRQRRRGLADGVYMRYALATKEARA